MDFESPGEPSLIFHSRLVRGAAVERPAVVPIATGPGRSCGSGP
jgi:hypothetical protein